MVTLSFGIRLMNGWPLCYSSSLWDRVPASQSVCLSDLPQLRLCILNAQLLCRRRYTIPCCSSPFAAVAFWNRRQFGERQMMSAVIKALNASRIDSSLTTYEAPFQRLLMHSICSVDVGCDAIQSRWSLVTCSLKPRIYPSPPEGLYGYNCRHSVERLNGGLCKTVQ